MYVLEAYVPQSRLPRMSDLHASARAATCSLRRQGRSVRLIRSIYLPTDETCFLLVDTADRNAVDELAARLDVTVVRIVKAITAPASVPISEPRRAPS
jgi:hypothetical protein